MNTHAGSPFIKHVTLTFDLLIEGQCMPRDYHAFCALPPSLVLSLLRPFYSPVWTDKCRLYTGWPN